MLRLGAEMAAALSDLHQQRVLHLDLKPANILFRAGAAAVLIDFGLSRHELLPDLLEEQFHRPVGTTEYMAPEQLMRVRSDRRSDIFALGVILYQLATGQLPFGIPARMRQVRRRVWRDPLPPRALRPEIPAALQEIILRCLEPMPDARYPRAEDLMFELRHPDLVVTTERGERLRQSDFRTAFARRLRAGKTMREILASATREPARAPIILVAVSLRPELEAMRQALLDASASALANMPGRASRLRQRGADIAHCDRRERRCGGRQYPCRTAGRIAKLCAAAAIAEGQDHLSSPRGSRCRERRSGIRARNKVDHLIVGAHIRGGSTAARSARSLRPRRTAASRSCVRPPATARRRPSSRPHRASERNRNSARTDPATASRAPPLPGRAPALKLKTLNPDGDTFKFTVVGLKRRLNQVRHAVREAAREVDLFSRDLN